MCEAMQLCTADTSCDTCADMYTCAACREGYHLVRWLIVLPFQNKEILQEHAKTIGHNLMMFAQRVSGCVPMRGPMGGWYNHGVLNNTSAPSVLPTLESNLHTACSLPSVQRPVPGPLHKQPRLGRRVLRGSNHSQRPDRVLHDLRH